MRAGNVVQFTNPHGESCPATVTAVVGAGVSGYKLLDLLVAPVVFAAVPHVGDASDGEAHWAFLPVTDEQHRTAAVVVEAVDEDPYEHEAPDL